MPKVTKTNTKQELLDAYTELLALHQKQEESELNPEKITTRKKEAELFTKVDKQSGDSVASQIHNLKNSLGKMLNQILQDIEGELSRYQQAKEAVALKEKEIQELYGVEKQAATLASLIEAQNKKRQDFEGEIELMKKSWEKEQQDYQLKLKEEREEERKKRSREKEEYVFNFEREKQKSLSLFEDEKEKTKKELTTLKETELKKLEDAKKNLDEKFQDLHNREKNLSELNAKVEKFPAELSEAVSKAVEHTRENLTREFQNNENLLRKEYEGQKNLSESKINLMEATIKEQKLQIDKLAKNLQEAYDKIQQIAVKTVEGQSGKNLLSELISEKSGNKG